MDIYTLKQQSGEAKKITKENFENDTKKKYPWFRQEKDNISHYAICPSCNNPIQIIRLYPKSLNSGEPYGRHAKGPLPDLSGYNHTKLLNCHLYRPISFQKTSKKQYIDTESIIILKTLIRDFYKIVPFCEQCTGIRLSKNKLKQMIKNYLKEQGYLYSAATIVNIPWMFLYFSDSTSLYAQTVLDDSLIDAIKKHIPHVNITPTGMIDRLSTFIRIDMAFIHHKSFSNNHGAGETMNMVVTGTDGNTIIYTKRINFDYIGYTSFQAEIKQDYYDLIISVIHSVDPKLLDMLS